MPHWTIALLAVTVASRAAGAQDLAPTITTAPVPAWTGVAELQEGAPVSGSLRWHRTLGTVALGTFGAALVAGSASGNLGKLMDETQCCPDGGQRNATWRTVDRALVNVGIASYLGAASIAVYRAAAHKSNTASRRTNAHRALAMAHGLLFVTSAVTGGMMGDAQDTDPRRFARLARIHVASNVAFVPLLAAAFTTMTGR